MKRVTLLVGIIMGVVVMAQAQSLALINVSLNGEEVKAAKFELKSTVHDFGKIDHNVPVTATFKFQNTGQEPLIITEAKGSCGCTVANYTETAVAPGEYGSVTATYNAAKLGAFQKTVTVTANTQDGPLKLKIKGEVVASE